MALPRDTRLQIPLEEWPTVAAEAEPPTERGLNAFATNHWSTRYWCYGDPAIPLTIGLGMYDDLRVPNTQI